MYDINLSQAFEQSGRNANVRKQEKEIAASVVLVVIRRGAIAAGPHSTATAGLRLKTLCAFQLGWSLHVVARCAENKLGVTMITGVT